MQEFELPRPELYKSFKTGNIVLRQGTYCVYVRVVHNVESRDGTFNYRPQLGDKRVFRDYSDLIFYTGPIDDEMLAYIMMCGG